MKQIGVIALVALFLLACPVVAEDVVFEPGEWTSVYNLAGSIRDHTLEHGYTIEYLWSDTPWYDSMYNITGYEEGNTTNVDLPAEHEDYVSPFIHNHPNGYMHLTSADIAVGRAHNLPYIVASGEYGFAYRVIQDDFTNESFKYWDDRVPVIPGASAQSTSTGLFEAPYKLDDVNGNGSVGFADVVFFFNQIEWIAENCGDYPYPYDFDNSGTIGFDDVNVLFNAVG